MQVAEIGSVKKRLHKRRLLTLVLALWNPAKFYPPEQERAISVLVDMLYSVLARMWEGGLAYRAWALLFILGLRVLQEPHKGE